MSITCLKECCRADLPDSPPPMTSGKQLRGMVLLVLILLLAILLRTM